MNLKYIKLIFLIAVVAAMAGAVLINSGNPLIKAQEGDTVAIYYIVTRESDGRLIQTNVLINGYPMHVFIPEYRPNPGSLFYSPYRNISGVPIVFVLGEGELISGPEYSINYEYNLSQIMPELENAVYGMHVNQVKNVRLSPERGYGYYDPQLVVTYNKEDIADVLVVTYGREEIAGVWGNISWGEDVYDKDLGVGTVTKVTPGTIVVDYNSRYADQYVNVEIKLLKIN